MVTTKRTGPANLQPRSLAVAVAAAFLPLAAHGQTTATTLPTGFTNVAGGATVAVNGSTMTVNSASTAEINNWQTFSIGGSATVNFNQLSASSVSLNRVVGNSASEIFGRLTANGQVFLVNNNGVLFARGSSVDVGGLFVTSLSIADKDFLAGRYQFFNPGNAGAVINEGSIITASGFAALAGPQVRNDGVIIARSGSVALAAGDRVSLDIIGDGLISVSVDQAALNASAINTGTIQADGGMVLLTARSANALLDTVINNSGVIRANSLVERNGEIVLDGGSTGVVSVTGTLEAAGTASGTTGGTIKVLGDKVGLFDGATLNASGDAGGGTVLVGGNFQGNGPEHNALRTYVAAGATINADAVTSGDGGKVIVWSDDITRFYGTITARGGAEGGNGGFAEVSGKGSLNYAGFVDLRAPKGATGKLLLDPRFIEIDAGGGAVTNITFADDPGGTSTISGANLAAAIEAADVTLQANTNITFNDTVDVTTGTNNLTLQAGHSIIFTANGNLTMPGAFSATFNDVNANASDRAPGMAGFIMDPASSITARRGITIAGGALAADENGASSIANNTGDITLATLTTSSNEDGVAAGNISVTNNQTAGKHIFANGTLTANGRDDNPNGTNAGAITLTASGMVTVSTISAIGGAGSGSDGNGGHVTLSGDAGVSINGDITVTGEVAGNVTASSLAGDITVGGNVSGAAITFDAGTNVTINDFTIIADNSTLDIKIGQAGGNGTLTISANATLTANAVNVTGGAGSDTIAVTRDANMTLSDGSLEVDGAYNLTLAGIEAANLTGGASDNLFTVSGWTGTGALDGAGGTGDRIVASKDTNFTLSDSALTSSDNMNLSLANIEVANLTGGASANTFVVSNWTGNATLGGSTGDDVFNVTLSASGTVVTTGGGNNDTLNMFGTAGADAINVNATAVENGQVVTYVMEQVNVFGAGGGDTVTIAATTAASNYSIDGAGTATLVVSTDANFTLTNALLQVNGSGAFAQANISLTNVAAANLTGGGSDNTFTVSGWNGTGTLDGSTGSDSVIASKDVNFTLSNAALTSNDSMSLALSSIEVANLTGGASNNSFTVSGWNGTGTFDGGAGTGDRIFATNDVNFTLSTTLLQRSGMTNQTLANIEAANLTGGVSANTFDVSGWTGLGRLDGGPEDTIVASKDANFTLTNTFIASSDGMNMSLSPAIGTANLTSGAGNNTFTVTSWQADANLVGGGGADTFNLTLTGTTSTYSADGGLGTDTVNVFGTGSGDVIAISNTSVTTSVGESVTYANAEAVSVSGVGGGDIFTFTGFLAGVNYTILGTSGIDTLNITAIAQNITLTGGSNGTISNVGSFSTIENLVGANTLIGGQPGNWTVTGANSGTVSGAVGPFNFSGTGNLVGSAGNDTFAMGAAGSLSGSISGGGGVDTLTGSPNANAWTITGANSGTLNGVTGGWSGISNLAGGTGNDSFTGAGGAVNITDGVGGTTTLTNLQTTGSLTTSGATTLNGTIQSGGNQTYSGAVTLGSPTSLNAGASAVNFGGTVDGATSLDVTATTAVFSAGVGSVTPLSSLTVSAPNIFLNGVVTNGAQTYTGTTSVANTFTTNGGAFNVTGNTVAVANTVVNSGAGPATFNGTVNGPGSLTVNGSGLATFVATISGLGGLTVNAPSLFQTNSVSTTGAVALNGPVSAGAITFNTGGGSFNAFNAGNDFTGATSVVTGSGDISIRDANALILGPVNAGAGFITLNAGSLQGAGAVTGGSGSITSLADISGMGLNMPGNMVVSGTGGVQTFSFTVAPGASQPGSYTQGGDVAVFINNALAFPNSQHTNIGAVVGNAAQAAGAIIVEEANKTFGTDSVAEDIEYGFAGEIGATPPMDHRIDESGISLPRCVQESREGLPCK